MTQFVTIEEIAEEYEIPVRTLRRHLVRCGWHEYGDRWVVVQNSTEHWEMEETARLVAEGKMRDE